MIPAGETESGLGEVWVSDGGALFWNYSLNLETLVLSGCFQAS